MILPYFIRINSSLYNDVRVCRNYLVVGLVTLSFLIFITKRISLAQTWPITGLLVLGWFNHQNFYSAAALEQTVVFSAFCLLMMQMMSNIDNSNKNIVINYLRLSCLLQVFLMLLNYFFSFNPYNPQVEATKILGSFGQETLAAAYVAILAPLFLVGRWRWFLFPIILAVVLSTSAIATTSLVAGILFYFIIRYFSNLFTILTIFTFVLFAFLAFALYFIDFNYFDDKGRFLVWSILMKDFFHSSIFSILFGHGFGYIYENTRILCKDCKEIFTYAHNEYIEAFFIWGISSVFLIYPFIKRLFKSQNFYKYSFISACLVALSVNCIGNFPLHLSPIGLGAMLLYTCIVNDKNNLEVI